MLAELTGVVLYILCLQIRIYVYIVYIVQPLLARGIYLHIYNMNMYYIYVQPLLARGTRVRASIYPSSRTKGCTLLWFGFYLGFGLDHMIWGLSLGLLVMKKILTYPLICVNLLHLISIYPFEVLCEGRITPFVNTCRSNK